MKKYLLILAIGFAIIFVPYLLGMLAAVNEKSLYGQIDRYDILYTFYGKWLVGLFVASIIGFACFIGVGIYHLIIND